ncbi:Uncharacterised protein [Serratia proteamaculans]|nr:Uncharacterised protein [Serratia proteamaculans]
MAPLIINTLAGVETHFTVAALHQLAIAVRQAVGIQRDLLRRRGTTIQHVVATQHTELAVGQQLAAIALQPSGIHRQCAFTGMHDFPALVVDTPGIQRQAIAVAGDTATGVVQLSLRAQRQIIAAKLGDFALTVR